MPKKRAPSTQAQLPSIEEPLRKQRYSSKCSKQQLSMRKYAGSTKSMKKNEMARHCPLPPIVIALIFKKNYKWL
jgi:hypothetical protein